MKTMRRWMDAESVKWTVDFLTDREIWVVQYDEDGRTTGEIKRKATKAEKKILRGIFAGAVHSMNWGEDVRSDDGKAKAIIDCAEFTALSLLGDLKGGTERIQSYLSVYIPLSELLRDWARETK